jgi:predicted NAD/FAD-binding protein
VRNEANLLVPANPLNIAVIGSGISGLSAAWLLSSHHQVTVFEADNRIGGHSNTVDAGETPVDTGFIVYNEVTYPNLTALFRFLDVPTKPSDMSFAVSLDGGRLEYSGTGLSGLFAQPANLASPRFWSMLRDLLRFYRTAPGDAGGMGVLDLGDYLDRKGYGQAFREDHLYPMAAAIWSAPAADIARYPAAAFVGFCKNHGLLKLVGRPVWRTVDGGSRAYVERLTRGFADRIVTGNPIRSVRRLLKGVEITDQNGHTALFDHVVIASHADQALKMLADPSEQESRVLSSFSYCRNETFLHSDPRLMPRRKRVWSSWNYMSAENDAERRLSVTYWMNKLQGIQGDRALFVSLNPLHAPAQDKVIRQFSYDHPVFDSKAIAAQHDLWSLQGHNNTWFCGAYFGSGFHEDGLQSGLAVAEALGGVRRPWSVAGESGRIRITPMTEPLPDRVVA